MELFLRSVCDGHADFHREVIRGSAWIVGLDVDFSRGIGRLLPYFSTLTVGDTKIWSILDVENPLVL